MLGFRSSHCYLLLGLGLICGLLVGPKLPASPAPDDRTSVQIVVTDAESGQPISQAHLTMQFNEPGNKYRLKRGRPVAFSAKTNPQGRYKFLDIPKGTIHLMVTADHHEAFGKDFEIEKDDQVVEVKLKKPQPQI